ncbi:diaminopimelate decarboxylase [Flexibacter flexilis DSM 6793]|uniref:Diaminopimelate decarboxylase n=1 Tax=Flexibacter flexilis DSM 6793 TaxID=927664 RepID=A0A1I1GZF4_9BACT|nr:diaminopimelate decarboxylase [Flexibacter flexilis]SFC17177.1 diaminopimelate decarboxylase [Flexibacter flexilis DSM 6793]
MQFSQQGPYQIQGLSLEALAQEYGTPLYVYDADIIERQVQSLHTAFGGLKHRIKYAAKALTNQAILKLMNKNGVELDVVSIEEAQLGLQAGFAPSQILYTPNSVSFKEIQEAVALGLTINIDNISILEQFGNAYESSVPCCIRINPHIVAGGNAKIQTGHIDSKFGISILQMKHVARVVRSSNIRVEGLHIHTGSEFLNSDVFLQGAELVFDAATDFPDLRFIDFGSGFKVAYKEGDHVTDVMELGQKMTQAFKRFCAEYGRELEIWFEPGKYLVSECGYLLANANVVKTTPSSVFVGVDTGLNHLIRPMMYDAYHEIVNISNPEGAKRIYTVVGYICETDTFGYDRKLSEVREGDVIAFLNAGAYGFSMSSNYNSRLRPAEVLIYKGKAHLIRRREVLDDLLRTQVDFQV